MVIVVVAVVLLAGGDGGEWWRQERGLQRGPARGRQTCPSADRGPDAAAKAAGCTLTSYKGKSREHTDDLGEKIKYDSNPPTEGKHFATPAEDGAYDEPPDVKELVHSWSTGG